MVYEFLRDKDGYEMTINGFLSGKIEITIKDPEVDGKSLSFILDKNDANYVIKKLNEFNNG